MENFKLYHGDSIEILDELPMVSAVITDPPYMINTKSDGNKKLNPWSDYCNGAYWYTAWIRKVREHLKPDGCLWTCLNWRSFVTFQKAACDAGWPIESLLVWDKQCIGTGGQKGLRPSYELVALFAMPEFQIPNRGLPDIQRFKWSSKKPHDHPAEKPEDLMRWLIENSTKEGDTVLDLFMGSGTTGAAAISTGRKFIGIEQNEKGATSQSRGKIMINTPYIRDCFTENCLCIYCFKLGAKCPKKPAPCRGYKQCMHAVNRCKSFIHNEIANGNIKQITLF